MESVQQDRLPRLYTQLADWWPLLSSPDEYTAEAELYRRTLLEACSRRPETILELGSGGGNNASHLKKYFHLTLVDRSEQMLAISRALNPECEHLPGDMRTIRLDADPRLDRIYPPANRVRRLRCRRWLGEGFPGLETRKSMTARFEQPISQEGLNKMDKETELALRQIFKQFNRFMLLLWRLGLGRWFNLWPEMAGQIMVIVHTGRKTGLRRFTPVNYAELDGQLYCVAGFGSAADWYKNIIANPQVEVWHPQGWWQGMATDISRSADRVALIRAVMVGSGFAAPLFGLDPRKLDDHQLEQLTAGYPLIHIQRLGARTGPGGPGELAWLWPLSTFALLAWILFRPRRK